MSESRFDLETGALPVQSVGHLTKQATVSISDHVRTASCHSGEFGLVRRLAHGGHAQETCPRTLTVQRAVTAAASAMVLIFEGADLAGKSTLARHYLGALGLPVVKIRWDLGDERTETIAFARVTLGLLAATRAGVILDRSFVSMWAYTRDPK